MHRGILAWNVDGRGHAIAWFNAKWKEGKRDGKKAAPPAAIDPEIAGALAGFDGDVALAARILSALRFDEHTRREDLEAAVGLTVAADGSPLGPCLNRLHEVGAIQ